MRESSQDVILYRGTGRKSERFTRLGICFNFDDDKTARRIPGLDPCEIIVEFYEDSRSQPQRLIKRDLAKSRFRRFMIKIPGSKGQKRWDDIPVTKFVFTALVIGWSTLPTVDDRRAIRLQLKIVAHIEPRQRAQRRRLSERPSFDLDEARAFLDLC